MGWAERRLPVVSMARTITQVVGEDEPTGTPTLGAEILHLEARVREAELPHGFGASSLT